MMRRRPIYTRAVTLFPYTALFRASVSASRCHLPIAARQGRSFYQHGLCRDCLKTGPQPPHLRLGEMQPQLAAPPPHVVGGSRPFARGHPLDLGGRQPVRDLAATIVPTFRLAHPPPLPASLSAS